MTFHKVTLARSRSRLPQCRSAAGPAGGLQLLIIAIAPDRASHRCSSPAPAGGPPLGELSLPLSLYSLSLCPRGDAGSVWAGSGWRLGSAFSCCSTLRCCPGPSLHRTRSHARCTQRVGGFTLRPLCPYRASLSPSVSSSRRLSASHSYVRFIAGVDCPRRDACAASAGPGARQNLGVPPRTDECFS